MLDEVAPMALEAVPAAHRVQVTVPEVVAYDPAVHWVQLEAPELEKLPAGQVTQVVDEVAPTVLEAVPGAQELQLAVPEAYVPGGQVVAV